MGPGARILFHHSLAAAFYVDRVGDPGTETGAGEALDRLLLCHSQD
jgi:hypothetical protein